MPSVFLAMPTHRDIHPSVMETLILMVSDPESYVTHIKIDTDISKRIDIKRNDAVEECLKTDSTHLLFVDSDTVLIKGAVKQLIDHDVPVIGAVIYKKGGSYAPVFGFWVPERQIYQTPLPFRYDQLAEVDIVGAGFLLIKREVLEKLQRPYFKCLTGMAKEDVYFCIKCKEAGFSVYVDTGLHLGHVADHHLVTNVDYEKQLLWTTVQKFKEQGRYEEFREILMKQMNADLVELKAISQDDPKRRLAFVESSRRLAGRKVSDSIKKAYIRYLTEVSGRTIAWELVEFLDQLMLWLKPKRVLDLGSGFTSYFFRQYSTEVWSVDHDPKWLEITRDLLEHYGVVDERLVLLDEFQFKGMYDIIIIDTGPTEMDRVKLFEPARKHCSGAIILDDINSVELQAAAREFFKDDVIFDLWSDVADIYGRYAWMIVPRK